MENLENGVVESAMDVVSSSACPIKKALPVLLPLAALIGLGFLVVKAVKKNKAKKLAAAQSEEVNPAV